MVTKTSIKKLKKINFINKNVIITGASRGIGYQLAKNFLKLGANISICSQNFNNLKKAIVKLKKIKNKNQKIFFMKVDISKKKDVDKFFKFSVKEFKSIHILINNAGIYGPKGFSETVNWNKWIKAVQVNLFGSILIARHIIKHFKKNNYGKIIQLAGGGVAGPLPMMSAYGCSKIAIVRFMDSLSKEVKDYKININTVAPGSINTDMLKEVLKEGPKKIGNHHYKKALFQKKMGGTPIKKAIELITYLSSDSSNHINGKIINAIWDDWLNLSKYKNILNSSDIFTLKRINPLDRGHKWGIVKKKIKFDTLFSSQNLNKK